MHHFQNGGITPLCIPLSSLLQTAAGTQTRNRACLDCRCNEGEDISDAFKDRLLFRIWQSEQGREYEQVVPNHQKAYELGRVTSYGATGISD